MNELFDPGIFNFACGIMLQNLECDEVSHTKINEVTRTKARGFTHDADADVPLPECYVYLLNNSQLIIKC